MTWPQLREDEDKGGEREGSVVKPLGWSMDLHRASQGAPRAQRQAKTWLGFVSEGQGKEGSAVFSWGPGPVHKAAEGSSGMLSLLLVPALVSLPART